MHVSAFHLLLLLDNHAAAAAAVLYLLLPIHNHNYHTFAKSTFRYFGPRYNETTPRLLISSSSG